MLILFDQATPVPIRSYLKGHLVRTAAQQGWSQVTNGHLLAAAESAGFNLLLTTDRSMRHQQNLAGRTIAILVIARQQWPDLRPHIQLVVDAVNGMKPGAVTELSLPTSGKTESPPSE